MAELDASTRTTHSEEENKPRFELEEGGIYSKFLLHSRAEILFVMRGLAQKGAMITVYFDHGASFLLTSLVAVAPDGSYLIFDYGSNEEMNRRALAADKLIFTTVLDKVKIQFSLKNLEKATVDGQKAFKGEMPDAVLRLQRREYYRLTTPISTPLRCVIPIPQAGGSVRNFETTVLDISGGGLGIMVPSQSSDFEKDAKFPNCVINLPQEGDISVTLMVRNSFFVTTKSGGSYLRVGLEFVDLPGTRLTMIQRYITRIERERKARLSGLQ